MCRALMEESPEYDPSELNEEQMLANAEARGDSTEWLVAEAEGGELVGYALLALGSEYWVGPGLKLATDISIYVKPEWRGRGVGKLLVRAAEGWAASKGARHLYLGVSTGITSDRTIRLYESMGYEIVSTSLRKALGPEA